MQGDADAGSHKPRASWTEVKSGSCVTFSCHILPVSHRKREQEWLGLAWAAVLPGSYHRGRRRWRSLGSGDVLTVGHKSKHAPERIWEGQMDKTKECNYG